MNLLIVQRILGLLLMLFSLTMLPPIGVSLYFADGNWQPFADAFIALLALGAIVWWPVRKRVRELRVRDGFLVVALFWAVLGIAGAAPLLLSQRVEMSVTDAVFEAVSGFTTTGATVIVGLDALPKSLLYYRNQIEWFGGIGIVVLAVALMPMLGVGGMQLLRAETPGPVKDTKLTPRITETAKVLWLIVRRAHCSLRRCILAGRHDAVRCDHAQLLDSIDRRSLDARCQHRLTSTMSPIEMIAIIFMFIGSVNFSLHFLAWRHRHLMHYFRDPEFKAFVWLLVVSTLLYTGVLWSSHMIADPGKALRVSLFQAVSMQTSSGFVTDNFSHWPGALPVIVMLSTFIGGCAGSTSGGMKVVRWLLMWKQGQREVTQLVHPSAELPVKLGRKPIDKRVIDAVWGFFAVYVASFGVLMVMLIAMGEDQVTAFSAIAACMNNVGTGLGEVSRELHISQRGRQMDLRARHGAGATRSVPAAGADRADILAPLMKRPIGLLSRGSWSRAKSVIFARLSPRSRRGTSLYPGWHSLARWATWLPRQAQHIERALQQGRRAGEFGHDHQIGTGRTQMHFIDGLLGTRRDDDGGIEHLELLDGRTRRSEVRQGNDGQARLLDVRSRQNGRRKRIAIDRRQAVRDAIAHARQPRIDHRNVHARIAQAARHTLPDATIADHDGVRFQLPRHRQCPVRHRSDCAGQAFAATTRLTCGAIANAAGVSTIVASEEVRIRL